MIGEAGLAPFELYPGIFVTTEEKYGKRHSGKPSSWRQLVAQTWPSFQGSVSDGLLCISSPWLPVGDVSQPLVGTCAFQVAELRGSPHQLTLSRNFVSALIWSAKNGIPKST
jgi:hypothetical protein